MGGDYGRGFWSVALLLRCACCVVGLALGSLVPQQAEAYTQRTCQTDAASCNANYSQACSDVGVQPSGYCEETLNSNGNNYYVYHLCTPTAYDYIHIDDFPGPGFNYECSNEPPPEPECPIPAGQTEQIISSSPLGSSTCYQNCLMTARSSGGISMMELTTGQRIYWYDATSTGDYCEAPSGAQSAPPFENYTDEDGCYMGFDGRYCPSGGGSCPNSATAPDGGVYCRTPPDSEPCNEGGGPSGDSYCGQDDPNYQEPSDSDGNSDSDGDGIPNADDPYPDDPDADGDGTPDGEQDGDGNGIPDGDPGGIDDGEGEGNEPGDGHHDGGTCEPGERVEPECSENMDAIQCALAIELFHVRCDATTEHRDFVGDDEYLEGPSITSSEDGDGDGQPDNAIPTATLDAGTVVAGLSEDTISFGNLACPADRTFSMPGAFGGSFTLSWEPICDWAAMVRPIVIALGYLMSALIILRKFSGGSD
jgi:hypothetical protein